MSKIFVPRLKVDGLYESKYMSKECNSFIRSGISIPNCTVYVNARVGEIYGKDPKDILWGDYEHVLGNAKYWYGDKSIGANKDLKRGSKPKLGAIACFDGNYGHVAVVEKIEGNKVTISYAEKGGTKFSLATEEWTVGKAYPKYGWGAFQGYIYMPDEFVLEEKPTTALKFKVGDKVVINGNLYYSSNDTTVDGTVKNKITKITRVAEGAKHPYNTTGDLGWMDEKDIKLYTNTTDLKVGDKVKIIGSGNGQANGKGKSAGGIGWVRYILKIHNGSTYPYQAGNDDRTTGFYQKSDLKKL